MINFNAGLKTRSASITTADYAAVEQPTWGRFSAAAEPAGAPAAELPAGAAAAASSAKAGGLPAGLLAEVEAEIAAMEARLARLEPATAGGGETKESIAAKVAAKGDEIAAVKKELGSKSHLAKHKIKPLVEQLLKLKAQYKEVTGENFPKSAAAAPKKDAAAPGTVSGGAVAAQAAVVEALKASGKGNKDLEVVAAVAVLKELKAAA